VTVEVSVVILAAGQGTRMRSRLPKVLQPLAGQPLLGHVIATAESLKVNKICLVYGHGGEQVRELYIERDLVWVLQEEQLGTGHAVLQAMPQIDAGHTALILYGDVPLVRPETLASLVSAGSDQLAVLTAELDDPTGYGRIIRDSDDHLLAIVEEQDATEEQKALREINTGMMACPADLLAGWLTRIAPDNAQSEYYLTDIIRCAVADGATVVPVRTDSVAEALGVNDKMQLAAMERLLRKRTSRALLEQGVTLVDPDRFDLRGTLTCGNDVYIDVNVLVEGQVHFGNDVNIGPNCIIRNTSIGPGTRVHANCVIEAATIGGNCEIGPFARMRPGVEMSDQSKLGNFVEVKKSRIGSGSKVNHLSYIGDTTIGEEVNVGAGTITCNYDGANKHPTIIGDGAFIGSGVELVAPVEIGPGATIGAGSTITKAAPAGELVIERSRQQIITGWKRPTKGVPKKPEQ
jgi:bifunctional UDP-N-acetylglucosamine pyrophosphorylase/glucosamine-1-phosphate N-acetyltransferase